MESSNKNKRNRKSPMVTRIKELKILRMADVQPLQQEKDDLMNQLQDIKNELLNNDVKPS